jgi:uncharacterized lipoprotein YmbA
MKLQLAALSLAAGLTGCASTPDSYYTLMPSTGPDFRSRTTLAPNDLVVVGPVTIPAMLDQTQMVISKEGNEMDVRETERWTAPLKDEITAGLTARLSEMLPDITVVAYLQSAGSGAETRVTADFSRFQLGPGQQTVLDALWTIKRSGVEQALRRGRTQISVSASGSSYAQLAAAQGRALDQLAKAIALNLKGESR